MSDPADKTSPAEPTVPAPPPAPDAETARTISSEDLLRGSREVLIEHAGETYRLRLTRNGKLILQK